MPEVIVSVQIGEFEESFTAEYTAEYSPATGGDPAESNWEPGYCEWDESGDELSHVEYTEHEQAIIEAIEGDLN